MGRTPKAKVGGGGAESGGSKVIFLYQLWVAGGGGGGTEAETETKTGTDADTQGGEERIKRTDGSM